MLQHYCRAAHCGHWEVTVRDSFSAAAHVCAQAADMHTMQDVSACGVTLTAFQGRRTRMSVYALASGAPSMRQLAANVPCKGWSGSKKAE